MQTGLIFIFIFLAVYFATPALRRIAVKYDILDRPNQRKMHKRPVPLLGGVAVYLGLILGLLFNPVAFSLLSSIIIGATIILVIGVIDDMR